MALEKEPGPLKSRNQAEGTPGRDGQGVGSHTQTPFLNPEPFFQWYGVKNIAMVRINGESTV